MENFEFELKFALILIRWVSKPNLTTIDKPFIIVIPVKYKPASACERVLVKRILNISVKTTLKPRERNGKNSFIIYAIDLFQWS